MDRWGIAVGYTAYLNYIDANYGDGSIDDALIAKYGSTNVRIENNYVKGAGGDAITLMYCDRPVIEHIIHSGGRFLRETQNHGDRFLLILPSCQIRLRSFRDPVKLDPCQHNLLDPR